jgi:hypothetical protein
VWVVTRALVVNDELAAASKLSQRAQAAMADGEIDQLDAVVDDFDRHVSAAAAAAADPVWRVAEVIPFVGANLGAVRVVTEQLDAVSSGVARPLVALAGQLSGGGLLRDGAIDVEMVAAAHSPLADAAAVLDRSTAEIAGIPRDQLVGPVADGVDDLESLVDSLSGTVGSLNDLTGVLPGMLGDAEPRSILVMIQNNAELRSGGGIAGSFAEVVADGGRLELARQADSSEFSHTDSAVLDVPESTESLYGDTVGRFVQNATSTPDFDLTARLVSTWWQGLTGDTPDIVLSIDPIVLRSLLAVTGPLALGDGTQLEQDTFVQQVMVRPYVKLDAKEQTAYFQDLTVRFFASLTTSTAPASEWLDALQRPIEQGRISVWSRDASESAVLAGTSLAGPQARHEAAGDDAFAVYLNDGTGAKMDSRLTVALGTAIGSCRADERQEVAIRVRLTNDAAADAGDTWPVSMTGGGFWGVTPGHIATTVAVAAPSGWFFGGTTTDGTRAGAVDVEDGGFPTSATEVTIAPGESALIEVRFVAPDDARIQPELLNTPLLRAAKDLDATPLACG